MPASVISVEYVSLTPGTQNQSPVNVTIPTDCEAAYFLWQYFSNSDGSGLSAITLNGTSPAQTFEQPIVQAGDRSATGAVAWYNPATGTRSLDVDWDVVPSFGPCCVLVYVKGGDLAAWRDVDAAAQTTSSNAQITLTTVSGDLLLRFDARYDTAETPPTNSSGWTSGVTGGQVDYGTRFAYKTASGTSEVLNSEDDSYSSIVAISIPEVVAPTAPTGRGLLLGVG